MTEVRERVAEALWDDMTAQVVGAMPGMPRRPWGDASVNTRARFLRQADVAIAAIRQADR